MTTVFTEFNHHNLYHWTNNFMVQEIGSLRQHLQLRPAHQGFQPRMISQWFQPCGVWWVWCLATTKASDFPGWVPASTRAPGTLVPGNDCSVISAGNCYANQTSAQWTCITVNSTLDTGFTPASDCLRTTFIMGSARLQDYTPSDHVQTTPDSRWRKSWYLRGIFTRGQFWPPGIVVACLCVFVYVCINHGFVRAITHHSFKLASPNLEDMCKRPWFRTI